MSADPPDSAPPDFAPPDFASPDFALGELMSAWAAGPAAAAAPERWAEALAPGGAEAELRLIALAAQALEVGWRPAPPGALTETALLPDLGLPFLSEPHRARFRRIVKALNGYSEDFHQILRFLAARGRVLHPLDWTPGENEEGIPDLYAPWRDWVAERAPSPEEALDAANWEEWTKAGRRRAFADLRKADPSAALALLTAKAPSLKAEERQDLVEALRTGLSEADRPFLEEVKAKDRSNAIKQLAEALLGRMELLGALSPEKAAALFYEEFLKVERKGILKRELKLSGRHKRPQDNTERLSLLIERAGLDALAAGAKASRTELAAAWPHDAWSYAVSFRALLLAAGSPAENEAAFLAICEAGLTGLGGERLGEMLDRAPEARRPALAAKALDRANGGFDDHLSAMGGQIGRAPLSLVRRTGLWTETLGLLQAAQKGEEAKFAHLLPLKLRILGGVLDAAGAAEALEDCARLGLSPADPRLDLLHLNAELPEAAP